MALNKTLKLYNTLTRQKQSFEPQDKNNVRMYVCGPTVYDYAHIGNARPIIVFDVLFRLLRHIYGETHVTYARNITDVDDKINARAAQEGVSIAEVTERTTKQFHQDISALGVLEPTHEPRATGHIAEMIEMIEVLIEKGNAYESDGHVLFHVPSMSDYGKLSNRTLDEMIAGARVEVASYKKDPTDFVLWKPSSGNAPGWPSPWGNGRPGWHIECSAMAKKYLGQTFDIHGGGIDLQFPHHENEIAQSRCAHGTRAMANVWMHNGFLQVEGEKMSKSLGNFITINELINTDQPALIETELDGEFLCVKQKWNGLAARFSMLQTKYREPIDWTNKRFLESGDELDKWYELLRNAHFDSTHKTGRIEKVVQHLCNDLNTWGAITELRAAYKKQDIRVLGEGMEMLGLLNPLFVDHSIIFFDRSLPKNVEEEKIDELIIARKTARINKDFAESDRIRDELNAMGIVLKDGADGTTWEVKR